MRVAIIVAMGKNRVIGKENLLPWHLPADLKHFKELTTGHPIIMGRKTYESIGKPLPNRKNIIVTRQSGFHAEGCSIANSLQQAIALAEPAEQSFIIGGATIYQQAMDLSDTMYITLVDADIEGDAFFPEWDQNNWRETDRSDHEPDEKNKYNYSFRTLKR